jgi:hypothetical protein
MPKYEEILNELKGRTGIEPNHEEELCRRIAEIEDTDGVVPGLTKADWGMTWVLMIILGLIPIIVEAVRFGVSA